jgi:tetratricopeptide (TPR) repeat protein
MEVRHMKPTSKSTRPISELREEAARSPESAKVRWKLGTALLNVGFLSQGERELEKAVELDPEMVKAWVNLGGARLSKWDFQGCIDANRRALECDPELVRAHYNLGLGYLYTNQVAEMVRCFERVVTLDPAMAEGHYYMAVGLHATGRVEEAREALAEAMLRGHSPDPEFMRELEKIDGASSPALIKEFGGDQSGSGGSDESESSKG